MIDIKNLVKKYHQQTIINGISLSVKPGEVAAIIGPSGGGKSTFLRCINGLEQFQGGEIQVGDRVLTHDTKPATHAPLLQEVRRKVGFVFQQFNLFPHLSALENVIEAPLRVLKRTPDEARAKAQALFARVGLEKRMDHMPRQLSGGQQQRVAIIRALAMEPEAILFDEPTSALDPVMANEVLSVMTDLAKDGQTMIVVTHSMSFARNVSSHVHVFANGHDVEFGPPDRVFGDPQHETTKSFLAEASRD
jgi:ABC-type polar amino acid transport system ATPase subunit